VSYVDAGYSIALGVLFLYAVALVLRRRRWERAMRVAQQTEHAQPAQPAQPAEHRANVEDQAHAEHAEEQTAPGARS
jgi:hypothetical protein